MTRAVNVSVVTLLGLILDMGGIDRDAALFFFRSVVDLVIFTDFTAELLVQHHGDRGGQSGLAVVDVADRADVDVRLGSFEFFLSHFSLLKRFRVFPLKNLFLQLLDTKWSPQADLNR